MEEGESTGAGETEQATLILDAAAGESLEALLAATSGFDLRQAVAGSKKGDGEGDKRSRMRDIMHNVMSANIFEYLVKELGSDLLLEKDVDGYYPVHCAINANAAPPVVLAMLAAMPEDQRGVQVDNLGNALHYAVEVSDVALVTALTATCPELLTEHRRGDNRTPLFAAVVSEQQMKRRDTEGAWLMEQLLDCRDIVDHLLPITPHELLADVDDLGRTALHYASTKRTATALIELMEEAAVYQPDEDGWRPLHIAGLLCNTEAAKVMAENMTAEQMVLTTDMGLTPLHTASDTKTTYPGGLSLTNITYFMDLMPQAMAMLTSNGHAPIHAALRMSHFPDTLLRLLSGAPDSCLLTPYRDGYTLLHYAADYGYPEVVRAILARVPEAKEKTDARGRRPQACAAEWLEGTPESDGLFGEYSEVYQLLDVGIQSHKECT